MPSGIDPVHYAILRRLDEAYGIAGPQTAETIARSIGVGRLSTEGAARRLRTLEGRGWVKPVWTLTDAGRSAVREAPRDQ